MTKTHIREWRYATYSMWTYCGNEIRDNTGTVTPSNVALVPDKILCRECRNRNILYATAKIGSEEAKEAHDTFLLHDLDGPEVSDLIPSLDSDPHLR